MHPNHLHPISRSGLSLLVKTWALPAILALAALAVPNLASAQTPTFNTVVATPTGSQPWQPPRPAAVGDFNGDGKLDALIVDGSDALRFMRGNGDGTFSPISLGVAPITSSNVVNLNPGFLPYLPHGVDGYGIARAADVNGDGKLDVICMMVVHLNFAPLSFITVMINQGNDANGVPQFVPTHYSLNGYDFRSITVGDLNGDGKPDFIVGGAYGQVLVYLNNGDGTFTTGQVTTIMPNVGGAVGQGVIADVNGDGKADFVVTDGQAGANDIFLGNGDGTLQAPIVQTPAASCIAVADLNKDGKADLIEGMADGSVSVYLGNGNGTFGSPANFATGASSWPSGFFISDVNGDGNLDVAVSLPSIGKVAILTGNGDGTLGSPNPYGPIPNPVDVTLADFTGDGKPEIASVSANGYGGQNFDVLTNTTVFAPPLPTQTLTILGGSGNPGDVAANVEYFNPATNSWQPAYLASYAAEGHPAGHPWGNIAGTNSWINYKTDGASDPGAGPTTANTLWYLYRVRFTVPADAKNPTMTFSLKADNFAQVAINGVSAGGLITGQADQVNADAVFSQAVQPGENTITIDVGDFGGLNGFNFRIDLTVQSAAALEIVPTVVPPVVGSQNTSGGYGSNFSYQIAATNAPASFGATGLPASLSLNSATGVISGTLPNTVGNIAVVLSATNTGGTGTGTLNINVLDLTPPVISAPAALTAEATGPTGAVVTFSATANDFISGATSVSATPASGSTFALGTSTVALSATDVAGNTATGAIAVTVRDTTPPVITAPADIVAEATSAAGATVMFSASAQDIVDGAVPVLATPASGTTFPLGATSVGLSATDAAGNSASASFHVTVQDTTAPVINSLTVSSPTLWPPNHKMVPVTVTANASDAVGVTSLKIISVTSNEPADDDGDGHNIGDIQITGNLTVSLRAERSGKGSGRIYTITVEAKDAAGNASTKTVTVTVPKDQKDKSDDHKGESDDHKDDKARGKKGGD